jgi:redox-sensitive bicupin YhaK (pirin superfamily)
VHFLQIWLLPSLLGTPPGYEQQHFAVAEKRGRLRLIASPDGQLGSVKIQQDVRLHAGLFDGAESVAIAWNPQRLLYVHVARGTITVNGHALGAGDALQATDATELRLSAGSGAEVLVFDLPATP